MKRLQKLGIMLALIGVGFLVASGVALGMVQDGYTSLDAFSTAQNVELAYNEDGQLVDRGTTEGAAAIMGLLTDDWGYQVVESDLDPDDPVVNTATEYMYQMATISYHTLNGTQTVVLTEDEEFNGEVFPAGTYEFEVDGRYWTDFNRLHPLDGPARAQAWNGTVHGLFAELGVGATTASSLQLALGVIGVTLLMAVGFIIVGGGLVWVGGAAPRKEDAPATA